MPPIERRGEETRASWLRRRSSSSAPGTGKRTFAKATAGRVGWPFVEVFPSQLGTDAHGRAGALAGGVRVLARTRVRAATTEDCLRAISVVRPSITAPMAREFEEDIERFARF